MASRALSGLPMGRGALDARALLWPLACALLLGLQALLVLRQSHGLDEWQALQIALQSPSLAALFENLRYEGHPPLWYLLLEAASLVVPAGLVLCAVQLPIALASQSLILTRLPLSRIERVLVSCSFAMLIDYGMMARSLGMGVLLLLAAFALRDRRLVWLPVALLPMADFLFGCLSILLLVLLWREKRLWTPGLMLWLATALFSAWSVRPAPDMQAAFWPSTLIGDALLELARFGTVLIPLQMQDGALMWNGMPPVAVAIPAGLLFFYMGLRSLRGDGLAQLLFAGFCAIILLFSVTVYPLATRHASLAGLLLILLVARARQAGAAPAPIFRAWLVISAICGLIAAGAVLVRPFHAAPQAARYIEAHGLAGQHWASYPDSRGQAVSGLTGIAFERLEANCTQSFIRWNFRSGIETFDALESELVRIANRSGGYYLLSEIRFTTAHLRRPQDVRLLTAIPPGYDGQPFYLYHVRPDLRPRAGKLPACAPRLPLRTLQTS